MQIAFHCCGLYLSGSQMRLDLKMGIVVGGQRTDLSFVYHQRTEVGEQEDL